MTISKTELLDNLPPEWPTDLLPTIRKHTAGQTVVVLDDDPTGTQTVHGVPVLTEWSIDSLAAELRRGEQCIYILTNSRSMSLTEAQALNQDIGHNLAAASQQTGRSFVVVSRSDSTLRGHFPGEVEALAEAIGQDIDAWLIIPYFLEGGRYTLNDIHYVAEGETLIPAGETPYAQDATFGYTASNLRDWVAEKTAERIPADQVASISLGDIRHGGPDHIAARLLDLPHSGVCIINAASYRDLEVVVAGLVQAEAVGKRHLYRTAASFVRVRAAIEPRPLLAPSELGLPAHGGGLYIIGSYVPKTTQQVNALLAEPDITAIEINVQALLDQPDIEVQRVAGAATTALNQSHDVVIYTSRQLVVGDDADSSLAIVRRVSAGVISIIRAINAQPRYIVAKGGITSSDVATQGLNVRRALVMGQILPGVPVWQLGPESRFPNTAYTVFPGNVGDSRSLADIRAALRQET